MHWLLALLAVAVLTSVAYRRRSIVREFANEVEATDRHVDIGVDLHVVRSVPDGETLIPGARPMRVLRTYHFGGIVDTKADPPRIVDISQNPQTWYCSEDQEPIILHRDEIPVGELALGGMGAGKTTAGVIWLYLRWLENLGTRLEGGITAPTETRLSLVFNELFRMWPHSWWTYNTETKIATLCDGFRLRGVSTHRQSASQGSRLQGFNWLFWLGDELQDQTREFIDIQARLRAKADGRAKRLATATAKDAPEWRTLKSTMLTSGIWTFYTLLGPNSPFVHPDHWDKTMKGQLSEREYKRLVLAEDLPPETATYPAWSRTSNTITVPELGWSDVTRHELRIVGSNYTMLVGHDPGTTMDVSLFLRAFVHARDEKRYHAGLVKPFWVVLGELNTETSTTEYHIKKLLETVRDRWQLNLLDRHGRVTQEVNQILVHADPASNSDQRTDKSVYTQFANAQIKCRPAAWNKTHDGHGRVPREPAVEMINSLFCNAANERRLFVAKDERGMPCAPKLVAAIESAERDLAGRAEVHLTKGRHHDMTHWPAALRYALWPIERPRLQLPTRES